MPNQKPPTYVILNLRDDGFWNCLVCSALPYNSQFIYPLCHIWCWRHPFFILRCSAYTSTRCIVTLQAKCHTHARMYISTESNHSPKWLLLDSNSNTPSIVDQSTLLSCVDAMTHRKQNQYFRLVTPDHRAIPIDKQALRDSYLIEIPLKHLWLNTINFLGYQQGGKKINSGMTSKTTLLQALTIVSKLLQECMCIWMAQVYNSLQHLSRQTERFVL